MKWIEANGVSLRYDLGGHGAETVVFMHEYGGAIESWDEVLPAFQQHFQTLRYDQRGFGMSEKVRGSISLEDVMGDLVGLLDGLGISAPCHLVGSASGAGLALAFALKHPERVARVAVSSPVTGSTAAMRASKERRSAAVEREGMRSCVEQALNASYPEQLRANRPRFETYRCRWLSNDPHSYAAVGRMGADMDLNAELASLSCPTLVLAPIHDKNRPPSMVRLTANQIRGARCVEVDSGHFMMAQTPELFAQHVVPFLRGL